MNSSDNNKKPESSDNLTWGNFGKGMLIVGGLGAVLFSVLKCTSSEVNDALDNESVSSSAQGDITNVQEQMKVISKSLLDSQEGNNYKVCMRDIAYQDEGELNIGFKYQGSDFFTIVNQIIGEGPGTTTDLYYIMDSDLDGKPDYIKGEGMIKGVSGMFHPRWILSGPHDGYMTLFEGTNEYQKALELQSRGLDEYGTDYDFKNCRPNGLRYVGK